MTRALSGQVVVVTGGAGAIGSDIVEHFVSIGATVVNLDVAATQSSAAVSLPCDLRDATTVADAFAEIARRFGRIDVLVHAAGVARDGVIWKLSVQDWDFVHDVNLRGAFLAIRHAVPIMRENKSGRIVLIGSINGSRGKLGTSAYAASKAGLIGLAKSVCRETAKFGILVNVVEPGWVRTPLTDSYPSDVREKALDETLLGDFVEPADITSAVSFLCGEGGRRITGQVLRVDAGQYLGS